MGRAAVIQYARLGADVDCQLRRGAWYRVVRLGARVAVLDVNREPLPIPRDLLHIAPTRPTAWTVVPLPRSAREIPRSWGDEYAVCPSCRGRAPLRGHPRSMRCPGCNGLFDVAWADTYLRS